MNYIFWVSICLSVASLVAMEHIEPSCLFPHVSVREQVRHLLNLHIHRQWGGQKKEQLKLLRHLEVSCFAENVMADYRLTAHDYQQVANDPIVLQAWIAYLPPGIRDIHIKRFFNEMTFTNNVQVLRLLASWGLHADAFEPGFLPRLIGRAKNSNYQELAEYLNTLSK